MASSMRLLAALCVVALLAVRSESHGLEDFPSGVGETTPEMQTFFKPEAAALPEALDASSLPAATMAAKPEATAIPTTTTTTTTADTSGAATGTVAKSSATPRRSVSVAAGVACGVAAVAVVGIAAAVAYVVRGRRGAARRGTEVQLGSFP